MLRLVLMREMYFIKRIIIKLSKNNHKNTIFLLNMVLGWDLEFVSNGRKYHAKARKVFPENKISSE